MRNEPVDVMGLDVLGLRGEADFGEWYIICVGKRNVHVYNTGNFDKEGDYKSSYNKEIKTPHTIQWNKQQYSFTLNTWIRPNCPYLLL